jgi:hypothetical protein
MHKRHFSVAPRLTCVASGAKHPQSSLQHDRTACPSRPTASRRGGTPLGTLRTDRFSQHPVQCFEHARAFRPRYTRAHFQMKHLPAPFNVLACHEVVGFGNTLENLDHPSNSKMHRSMAFSGADLSRATWY